MIADTLSISFRSLSRKRARTILTVSGITVGVALVVIVSAISSAGRGVLGREMENLGISGLSVSSSGNGGIGRSGINEEELAVIRATPDVETAMPLAIEFASSSLRGITSGTLICGIDAGAKQVISLTLKYGRLISGGDVKAGDLVCIVDETLARETYGRDNITGKTIILNIHGTQEEFRIIGIAAAESSLVKSLGGMVPGMVYIPYSALQSITGRDSFDQVAVRVSPAADVSKTEQRIISRLQSSTGLADYFRTENLSAQRDKLGDIMDIVSLVLTVISGISLIVSGLGIMTIMMVSVNERTREIGIKKAIGASDGRILCEFLMEAVIISVIGGVTGIAIGTALSMAGGAIVGIPVGIGWRSVAFLLTFTAAVGTTFGVYPAIKAAKLRPVDALS